VTCLFGEQFGMIFSRSCRDIAVVVRVVRRKEPQQADWVDPPINRVAWVGVNPIRPLLHPVVVAIAALAPAAL
jgi:hypothetical protein